MNRQPVPSPAPELPSRRRLLTLIGAGSAAAVATLLPRHGVKAGHDLTNALHLGAANVGTGVPTTLTDTIADDFLLHAHNIAPGGVLRLTSGDEPDETFDPDNPPALLATSQASQALSASTQGEGPAIMAGAPLNQAILAFGGVMGFGHFREEDLQPGQVLGSGEGVIGQSEQPTKPGVLGESVLLINRGYEGAPPPLGIGVMGTTGTGTGVIGKAFANQEAFPDGVGVLGESGNGIGVRALSATGHALDVVGKARFTTAGNDAVLAGQNSRFVPSLAVTALSHISVTLMGDPGPRQLQYVSRTAGSGFTVHFAGGGRPNQRPLVPFSYLIVEPGS